METKQNEEFAQNLCLVDNYSTHISKKKYVKIPAIRQQ